jgi:hypothetical protein
VRADLRVVADDLHRGIARDESIGPDPADHLDQQSSARSTGPLRAIDAEYGAKIA